MYASISFFYETATPILGGIRRKETLNALEKIKNTFLNEGRGGGNGALLSNNGNAGGGLSDGMRTLGAKNDFVRNQANRSTLDAKDRKSASGETGNRRSILPGINHPDQQMHRDQQGLRPFDNLAFNSSSNSSLEEQQHPHQQDSPNNAMMMMPTANTTTMMGSRDLHDSIYSPSSIAGAASPSSSFTHRDRHTNRRRGGDGRGGGGGASGPSEHISQM